MIFLGCVHFLSVSLLKQLVNGVTKYRIKRTLFQCFSHRTFLNSPTHGDVSIIQIYFLAVIGRPRSDSLVFIHQPHRNNFEASSNQIHETVTKHLNELWCDCTSTNQMLMLKLRGASQLQDFGGKIHLHEVDSPTALTDNDTEISLADMIVKVVRQHRFGCSAPADQWGQAT